MLIRGVIVIDMTVCIRQNLQASVYRRQIPQNHKLMLFLLGQRLHGCANIHIIPYFAR